MSITRHSVSLRDHKKNYIDIFLKIWLIPIIFMGVEVHASDVSSLEEEVVAAETAFAKSMADRNFENFKFFIDEEAVFWGASAQRGKAQVLEAWKGFFEGEVAPFEWKPETVLVLKSGKLALSTGPVWGPDGVVTTYYHSTWRKNKNDEWKIVFDKGQKYCP